MFLPLKEHKSQVKDKESNLKKRIALSFAGKLIKAQKRCAGFLQRKTDQLSSLAKKSLLIGFCLLSGGVCFYFISLGLTRNENHSFAIVPIKLPLHTLKGRDKTLQPSIIVTKNGFQKIQKFKGFLDSLRQTSTGKKIYDSYLTSRPGLMDSIQIIEGIYHSQPVKK